MNVLVTIGMFLLAIPLLFLLVASMINLAKIIEEDYGDKGLILYALGIAGPILIMIGIVFR